MNLKEIKEIINLMNENSLVEIEIEKEGMRIRLKKTTSLPEGMSTPIVVEKSSLIREPAARESAESVQKPVSNNIEIKAPMVGTFYRAPAPEAPPYIEVGQTVEAGQVICIIEAMKLMNEIKSEVKGKIVEVLVDNADPVEFGQPMFLVEPL